MPGNWMKMRENVRLASIDIGSNSVRLLIAEGDQADRWRVLESQTRITRLSGGFDRASGLLDNGSMERTAAVMAEYAELIRTRGIARTDAAATGISRRAKNAGDLLGRIERETGIGVRVIPGEQEAGLALDGALFRLGGDAGAFVFLDVGASSTELSTCSGTERRLQSLDLGVVELTEEVVKHDPPDDEELSALFRRADPVVSAGFARLREGGAPLSDRLVGTAGTVATVVAMVLSLDPYDGARVEGFRLTRAAALDQLTRVARLPLAERRWIKGLPAGREDVIVAGLVILLSVMEAGGFPEMTVADGGLLEGLLLRGLREGA